MITSTEGRICGRLYRRADGTLLTRDCPVGLRALRRRVARVAGATLAAVLGLLSPVVAQKHKSDKDSCKNIPAIQIEKKVVAGHEISVGGVVSDPLGAVVPQAELRLINKSTKAKVEAKTSDKGEFIFANLSKGRYSLEVESPGFKVLKIKELLVGDGEELLLTAVLDVDGSQIMGIIITEELMAPPGTMIISGEMIRRLPH